MAKIEIFVFIPMPENEFHTKDEIYRVRLYEMIDQLCDLNGKLDYIYDKKIITNINISLLDDNERRAEKLTVNDKLYTKNCEVLRFSVEFFDKKSEIEYIDRAAVLYLEKTIQEIFIIANFSILGSIEYNYTLVFLNNEITNIKLTRMDVWPLQRAFELTQKIGWPKTIDIDFYSAWNWFKKHDEYIDGFINNRTSRAINAFSRMISFNQFECDESMCLLWSLIGIEALYVEGKSSIMEQVREKIFTIFGEPITHKKIISKMYNFRSRFIHGDIDFPGFGYFGDASDKFIKYSDEQFETINIAVAILGSSLQYIIKNNWSGIKFEYNVSDRI